MGGFITRNTEEEMKWGGGGGLTIDLKGHHSCQGSQILSGDGGGTLLASKLRYL